MANQVLAAQMIPRLGVTGLASPPLGRLPSHLDLLRLLHHHQHYNLVGFQGMGKICCKIDGKTHKARCQEGNDLMAPWDECRTGCIEAKNPCLLAQIKYNWEIAHLPIKDRDEHILRAMGKVKVIIILVIFRRRRVDFCQTVLISGAFMNEAESCLEEARRLSCGSLEIRD